MSGDPVIEAFQRLVDGGRSHGAKSYNITSDTMEAILIRLKADDKKIKELRDYFTLVQMRSSK